MSSKLSLYKEFTKGIWEQNTTFKQILGMCPVLAVTVSAINGLAMALATTFVLVFSSIIVAIVKKLIPDQVRIAAYILIIATFVTIVDMVMKASYPDLSKSLGPYIPLIVVNCVILGRQEAFASKNTVFRSFLDAVGMGAGVLFSLILLGAVRELFGSGTIFGIQLLPDFYEPMLVMILPAGAFITLGLMMGLFNQIALSNKEKQRKKTIEKYLSTKNSINDPVGV